MDPDLWVVRLGPGGATRWHHLLGGSQYDEGFDAVQAADGGYVLAGNSWSDDGDVTGLNQGTSDLWVLELEPDAPAVLAVPPSTALPTDPDGDGRYEDVNGNGRPDFADVVLYFNAMDWIAANEPVAAFDFNSNDRVDFADVVWLFNAL
jgi:PKD repeat protein